MEEKTAMNHNEKMRWFREARYGLFIHWGLYAIPAGSWKGTVYGHGTEWLMKNAEIPVEEYRQLANEFNPTAFNADEWVRMAAEAFGVKYIVFTAKHHDGFAMYDSAASDYNIMRTPYGKDVVRTLSDACKRYGVVFCLYYSQLQDWYEPYGFGNTWDFRLENARHFRKYLDEKVKPQLKELLTNYGEIGLIWFDTPYEMDPAQCAELADYVRSLQPGCLVNGRVGYGLGDYRQMSDNSIPVLAYRRDWETPMTLNDTWGYRRSDENWKSPERVMQMLVDVVGKGGNLLINVGPDELGRIPEGSVAVLRTIGQWLKKNGESIYAAQAAPDFPYQLNFGGFTYSAQKRRLYMHVLRYPVYPFEICVVGLTTRVRRATLLGSGEALRCVQTYESARDEHRLRVWLPEKNPDPLNCVVALDLETDPQVQTL